MEDATSAPERALHILREPLRFGTITIVGGGCYGGYYLRQLERARAAGAAAWRELVIVDRDPDCAVARSSFGERVDAVRIETADWSGYFTRYLAAAAAAPGAHAADAIVPSPLMPHLMAQWIVARARERWPHRALRVAPLESAPDIPWQRAGDDGTHYVSFAEWMCPINCVEPAKCPATRGPRNWSLPPALEAYAQSERDAGRQMTGPFVFHCSHRAYGVGMIDVRDVLDADAAIARDAGAGEVSVLVGTASHCHGALQRVVIGAQERERNGSPVDSF